MRTLHYGKYTLDVPEGFNELTNSQLVKLMGIMQHRTDEMQMKIEALKVLSGHGNVRFYMLPADAVLVFLEYIYWAFAENTLTKQVLPKYDNFFGPSDELGNLRMKEFHFTEQYYQAFVANDTNEAELNKLIAVLYRPAEEGYDTVADKKGDCREPFLPHLTARYADRVSGWPLAVKLAILFYYDGCRQYLVGLYDEVFTGEGSGEDASPYGMYALMMELAGDKLGTIDKVEDMYLQTALASLEIMLQKAAQIANQQTATP